MEVHAAAVSGILLPCSVVAARSGRSLGQFQEVGPPDYMGEATRLHGRGHQITWERPLDYMGEVAAIMDGIKKLGRQIEEKMSEDCH